MNKYDKFTVTSEHLKLLRHANIRWENIEFGAPAIDGKRPYGNSFVVADIAEILGYEFDPEVYDHELEEHLTFIHKGTEKALEIVLRTGLFEPGEYITEKYLTNWRKI